MQDIYFKDKDDIEKAMRKMGAARQESSGTTGAVGELYGLRVFVDDRLPPDTWEMREANGKLIMRGSI